MPPILGEYAMHPLQRELRIKKGGIQAKIEAMGHLGFRCFLESPEASSLKSAAGAAVPTMEFAGVVVENGTVLRKWRPSRSTEVSSHGMADVQGLDFVDQGKID